MALTPIERVGRGLVVLALVWAVLIAAAPWLASMPAIGGPYLSAGVYGVGSLVCHQRPERSFHVAGVQWPVCGRCTGLYLSAAAGVLLAWAWPGAVPRRFGRWRAVLTWAALPTAATIIVEWFWPSGVSSALRAAAAAPLGAAVGALLAGTIGFRSKLPGCDRTRRGV